MKALALLERLKQIDFARFIQRQGNNYASANQIAAEGKAHWTNCLHSSLLRDKCSPPNDGGNAHQAIRDKTGQDSASLVAGMK